jgi:hypothetical protein
MVCIYWQTAQIFNKWQTNLAKFSTVVWQNLAQLFGEIQRSCLAKFSSFRVGETEWGIFCRAL